MTSINRPSDAADTQLRILRYFMRDRVANIVLRKSSSFNNSPFSVKSSKICFSTFRGQSVLVSSPIILDYAGELQYCPKHNRSSKVAVQGLVFVAHSVYIHTVLSRNCPREASFLTSLTRGRVCHLSESQSAVTSQLSAVVSVYKIFTFYMLVHGITMRMYIKYIQSLCHSTLNTADHALFMPFP
jgi:hypothetical protein